MIQKLSKCCNPLPDQFPCNQYQITWSSNKPKFPTKSSQNFSVFSGFQVMVT